MQLNSLTLNSNASSTFSQSQLALYDHKLAVVNTQVFVFGKTIQNLLIQTPLHKINLMSLKVEPIYTMNAPIFQDFIMFSFQSNIYFWGKTPQSQENKLFEFDGIKFTKLDQYGITPRVSGACCYTKFSQKYLLLFGCLNEIQFQNKWYLFDIQNKQWKQIVSVIQIPVCQKSDIIWINGRGYLLLQSCYDRKTKKYHKNLFYQIKFHNFKNLVLQLTQIPLSLQIKLSNVIFTNLFALDEQSIILLGGEQGPECEQNNEIQKQNNFKKEQRQIDLQKTKIAFTLNLETFQWNDNFIIVPIKGQNNKFCSFNHTIYAISGNYENKLISSIQYFDFEQNQTNKIYRYEQSLCYYCQCAFTYKQKLIYEAAIQKDYEIFVSKNRFQNRFLKKFAQSINTEIHAIGLICEYLISQNSLQIQINLCQQLISDNRKRDVKRKIQKEITNILIIKGSTRHNLSVNDLKSLFNEQTDDNQQFNKVQTLSISLMKLKLAYFKLGYGLLYVTSTKQNEIFVSYTSYSQIQFPQSNQKTFSEIFYTIKWNKLQSTFQYSSSNNRQIIFQNVKIYFDKPQQYQNSSSLNKKDTNQQFIHTYGIGITNLQKSFHIQLQKNHYLQDIRIKTLNQKNSTNSLRKYLKHLYLTQNIDFKLFLQNQNVQFINIYQKYQERLKKSQIKEIHTSDQTPIKKTQNQETHFSTNHDQIVCWKKIQLIQNCRLFEIQKSSNNLQSNPYDTIFIYHNKKLLKTLTTKKSILCGVIELIQNVQIQLNGRDFVNKSDERKTLKWIEQIQNEIFEEKHPSIEEM